MNEPNAASSYFVDKDSGARRELFPGVSIRAFGGESMTVSVVTFEPESRVEKHSHPHEQMGVLVSGRLEFQIGKIVKTLEPGDGWRIPGGVEHSVTAVGGPAVAFDVFHPNRQEYL